MAGVIALLRGRPFGRWVGASARHAGGIMAQQQAITLLDPLKTAASVISLLLARMTAAIVSRKCRKQAIALKPPQ